MNKLPRFVMTKAMIVGVVAAALWTDSPATAASEFLWIEACSAVDGCNVTAGCVLFSAGDIAKNKPMFIGVWDNGRWIHKNTA